MKRFDLFFPTLMNEYFLQPSFLNSKESINKNEDGYIIELEIPGFSKEEISIFVQDKTLIVHAKKEKENTKNEVSYSYPIKGIVEDDIVAKLENGILTLNLKQKKEEIAKKYIQIQ